MRQLFQVALAGTEADDRQKRELLIEALEDEDVRIKRACVEALGAMLTTYLSRAGAFEQVGAEPYRAEWTPSEHDAVTGYFRWALERLLEVWQSEPSLRERIEDIAGADLRNLLAPQLLPAIEALARAIVTANGHWFEGTKSIGDWLYYDRPSLPDEFAAGIRALYHATIPTDPVDQVLLYSRFWGSDINDPDKRYADHPDDTDYEYSARKAQALAPTIARDPARLDRIIAAMSSEDMNAPQAFAIALADHLSDPLDTFARAVRALDGSGGRVGIQFVRALLAALEPRLSADEEQVTKLVTIAHASATLAASPMDIISALRITDEHLEFHIGRHAKTPCIHQDRSPVSLSKPSPRRNTQ